jgi:hypothetical protein
MVRHHIRWNAARWLAIGDVDGVAVQPFNGRARDASSGPQTVGARTLLSRLIYVR